MNMNQVATKEPQTVPAEAAPNSAIAFIQMVERAASNPHVDVEKLERLLLMRERMEARAAEQAFWGKLGEMQPVLPVVEKRGRITINDKNDRTKIIQSTAYALWEDINEALRPVLKTHGFTLSFRTGVAADGKIMVTGILAGHGHREESTITLPHDSSGSKNAVQAVGSSTSYGKRYTAVDLLNLTFKDEDDDGKSAAGPETISEEQVVTLRSAIVETGADLPRFLKFFKIATLDDLPAAQFDRAKQMLMQRAAKGAE